MGWTAQYFTLIVIEGTSEAGVLLYSPAAGPGNLVGSWVVNSFTDQYGNVVPAGLNVSQGILNSVTINGATITASTIANTLLTAATIVGPTLSAGTIYETQITFDSGGGNVIGYSTTNTVITQTANGNYNFTCPAGVTSAMVELWGAGGGGGGGNNTANGGGSGSGGEYAQEPSYTLVPGNVYAYTVGNGGNGGTTNGNGSDGEDTTFDNSNIIANGGLGNTGHSNAVAGGTGSVNTIHHDGGAGGTTTSSGGASGANSGNPTATGNNGVNSSTSSGAAQPAAQTGSGRGGAGGNVTANGSAGGSPGAGGGGAGMASGTGGSFAQTFNCTHSRSYYGSDAQNGDPNGVRNTNGTCWQGGETATGGTANGTQKCLFIFNSSAIVAACAGATITEVDFTITNQHSWYGTGMTLDIREWLTSQGATPPASWNGNGSPDLTQQTIGEGQRKSFPLYTNTSAPADFADGTATGIALGPGATAYDLAYYGYFYGTGSGSNAVQLTMRGTKGTGFQTAGAGSDGQAKISYSSSSSIVFALSAVSGSDASSNAYAAGYTGPVSAFTPGSSPATVETWHAITMDAGWATQTGYSPPSYRILPNGDLQLKGCAFISYAAAGAKTLNNSNPLPGAYRPAYAHDFRSGDLIGSRCHVSINTSGVIIATAPSGAAFPNNQFAEIDAIIPLG